MINGPRSGAWSFPGITTAKSGPTTVNVADLERAFKKLQGVPAIKWVLMSPEGKIWADADPMKLAAILAERKLGLGDFDIKPAGNTPLGDGEGANP